MLKFLAGAVVGIYVEQQYPGHTLPLKPIVNGLIHDIKTKTDEYNKDPKYPKPS
jgi:hypothetical protein